MEITSAKFIRNSVPQPEQVEAPLAIDLHGKLDIKIPVAEQAMSGEPDGAKSKSWADRMREEIRRKTSAEPSPPKDDDSDKSINERIQERMRDIDKGKKR